MRAVAPTPGSKYRIKVGQTIGGLCWSNAATTIQGFWTIVYDDGDPDYWPIVQSASGSSRAAVAWSTQQVAKKNGWVVGGLVGGGGSFQRGQLYHQAYVVDTNLTVVSDIIACGYAYAGHVVQFGTFVEPGPAGGQGQIRSIAEADPAAGLEVAEDGPPTGAIWRVESYSVLLVQGITQTPLPTLRIRSGANVIAQIPITPTAITASSTARLTWGRGTVQTSFTAVVGDEFHIAPIPDILMDSTRGIGTITDGIGANTDYGIAQVSVEEWVMPN